MKICLFFSAALRATVSTHSSQRQKRSSIQAKGRERRIGERHIVEGFSGTTLDKQTHRRDRWVCLSSSSQLYTLFIKNKFLDRVGYAVVVVASGDIVCCSFYIVVSVFHRYAQACKLHHWQIVMRITAGKKLFAANMQHIHETLQAGRFFDTKRHDPQDSSHGYSFSGMISR